MSWSADEQEQITRIEVAVEGMATHGARLSSLERFRSYLKGAAYAVGVIGGGVLILLGAGCATSKTRCVWHDNGQLKYAGSRATVLGGGETTTKVLGCERFANSTSGTGLTNNGLEAIKGLADAAARATVAGAVTDVLEEWSLPGFDHTGEDE